MIEEKKNLSKRKKKTKTKKNNKKKKKKKKRKKKNKKKKRKTPGTIYCKTPRVHCRKNPMSTVEKKQLILSGPYRPF